jgi:hypothetical protein
MNWWFIKSVELKFTPFKKGVNFNSNLYNNTLPHS